MYLKLNAKQVLNVPTAMGGGPVGLKTLSQEAFPDDDPETAPVQRELHRLVLKEVAIPLERYENANELVNIVFDALQGAFFAPRVDVCRLL